MSTPLYTTDVQKITDRTAKTTLADTDVLVVANSSGTLAPITKPNAKATLGVDANTTAITTLNADVSTDGSVLKVVKDNAQNANYDPAISGLSATTLKGAVDELASDVDTKVKLTKMPDGATAVYSQDAWATVDGWTGASATVSVAITAGAIRATLSGGAGGMYKTAADWKMKTIIMRYRQSSLSDVYKVNNTGGGTQLALLTPSLEWTSVRFLTTDATTGIYISLSSGAGSGWIEIDFISIGDYSYLDNTLATEASRIANQIGDTAGVGTKASGTITSNGTNVSDGDTVTIAGKVYTFKTVLGTTEGQVLIGGTSAESLDNLKLAINSTGVTSQQYCATFNPLVEATTNTDTVQTLSARAVGILGNSITLAKSASTLTLSSSTLTGGTDDVGEKMRTQIASLNGQWITPTLVNGWVVETSYSVRYMKDAMGFVHLSGRVKSGTVGVLIFSLPTGYKTLSPNLMFPCISQNALGSLRIDSTGGVYVNTGNNGSVFLDGITFKAEA